MSTMNHFGGRYIVPQIEERSQGNIRITDPYSKMFEDRVLFLAAPIDGTSSSDLVSQLLALDLMDSSRDITLYINSPGGSITDASMVIDAISLLQCDVATVCLGQASSVAALLLAAGTKGKRQALPNSRIMLHQPESGNGRGQASDIRIHAEMIRRSRDWMQEFLANRTGKAIETIHEDVERQRFLTPQDALAYGIIDSILTPERFDR